MGRSSKLQNKVSDFLHNRFGQHDFYENYRPEWLISDRGTRLELDFYLPKFKIAVEVQGQQHYTYIEYFHKDHDGFKKRLKDDVYKKDYCRTNSIEFIEISSDSDFYDFKNYIELRVLNSICNFRRIKKDNEYCRRLWMWHKGAFMPSGKVARNAFHTFLESIRKSNWGVARYKHLEMNVFDPSFMRFLQSKFPDSRYQKDFLYMKFLSNTVVIRRVSQ